MSLISALLNWQKGAISKDYHYYFYLFICLFDCLFILFHPFQVPLCSAGSPKGSGMGNSGKLPLELFGVIPTELKQRREVFQPCQREKSSMKDNPLMKLLLFSSVHMEPLIFFSEEPRFYFIFFSDSELWYFLCFAQQAAQWPWCQCEPWLVAAG